MIKITRARWGTLARFVAAALSASALMACGSEKADPTKDKPAANPPAGNNAPAQTVAATNFAPANSASPTPMNPTPANTPAAAGPNGRSPVPTQDEWTAAKEIGVRGSSKLNCETKMVREWLRVSCRGKNDTGGEPTNVTIKRGGGRGDTFTFASNKVASLVCPYVAGTDLAAEFSWTDKKKELVVSWPYGAPEPPLKGEFR